MSDETHTLEDLFGPSVDRLSTPEGEQTRAELQTAVSHRVKADSSKTVDAILGKLRDLLRVNLSAIIGMAWGQSEYLEKFLEQESLKPSELIALSVAEHAIESSHEPSMAIECNGITVGTVGVAIDLELLFEGMVLNVEQWKLTELNPGACSVSGTLGCLGVTLAEKETEPIQLPQKMRLGNGIRIGPVRIGKDAASASGHGGSEA